MVQRVKAASDMIGYDAAAEAYVDLIEAGVLDPTKVSRTALQNAASGRAAAAHGSPHCRRTRGPTPHHDGTGRPRGHMDSKGKGRVSH